MLKEGYARNPAGLRLYYRIVGDYGPTLVAPAACWLQEDLEPLARGRRVVFFDRSGRGRSDPIPADIPVTFASEFEDIDAIRAHLELERFALMGWSYMGLVAGLYAAEHADAVERLLLSGAIAPRNLRPTELPPEIERERDEALRRHRERVDAEALKQLEAARAAGRWTDAAAFCREYRRLNGPRQFGRPQAMLRTKADPCALPNEWQINLTSLMQRIFASLGETWDFRLRQGTSEQQRSSCMALRTPCFPTRRGFGARSSRTRVFCGSTASVTSLGSRIPMRSSLRSTRSCAASGLRPPNM